jgi:chromosome segregation ATPase
MNSDGDGADRLIRLQGELEQARVSLEDMEARVAELAAANAALEGELRKQSDLRSQAENRIVTLLADAAKQTTPATHEDAGLRQELSVALEELQVMQEELQTAHDALAEAQRATV